MALRAPPVARVKGMPLSSHEIDEIARALLAARKTGEPWKPPALPLDLGDAYTIQDAVARQHGGIDGWKVGAKDPTAIPTCAPLLRGTIIDCQNGGDVAVEASVGTEVEYAYRIGRDFDEGATLTDEEILDGVISAHVAVELCASRLAEVEQMPLWLLADNQMNERLVLGPAFSARILSDSGPVVARLLFEGVTMVETVGAHPVGDPRPLLCWAVRNCAGRFGGVKSGQVITTGSWTGIRLMTPPAQINAELVGFGALGFQLTKA